MKWWSDFFASFRNTPDAEHEEVEEHFKELRLAPAGSKKRADLTRTIQPHEINQMLQHTLEHVEEQTSAVTEEAARSSRAVQNKAEQVRLATNELAATGSFKVTPIPK